MENHHQYILMINMEIIIIIKPWSITKVKWIKKNSNSIYLNKCIQIFFANMKI